MRGAGAACDRLGFDTSMMDVCLFVQYFKKRKCSRNEGLLIDFAGRLRERPPWRYGTFGPCFWNHRGLDYIVASFTFKLQIPLVPHHTHVRARAHKRTLNSTATAPLLQKKWRLGARLLKPRTSGTRPCSPGSRPWRRAACRTCPRGPWGSRSPSAALPPSP